MKRGLRLLSDFRLPPCWDWSGDTWQHTLTSSFSMEQVRESDLIVVNGRVDAITKLALRFLVQPSLRRPIIAVDVVLRPMRNLWKRTALRSLFKRVDFFMHYFRDLQGYERFYGIGPDRSTYIAFKPNLRDHYTPRHSGGEYVLCFGESMRDYDNFFKAVEGLPIPAAISKRTANYLQEHASGSVCPVPANVRLLDDNFTRDDQIRIMEGARILALPVLRENICASGIGTYLNSMFLGKPVILTEGPGVSDVLTDQALIVPPGDPTVLREAILRLWNDQRLCSELSQKGRIYADSLGAEAELHARIRDAAMKWFYQQGRAC